MEALGQVTNKNLIRLTIAQDPKDNILQTLKLRFRDAMPLGIKANIFIGFNNEESQILDYGVSSLMKKRG